MTDFVSAARRQILYEMMVVARESYNKGELHADESAGVMRVVQKLCAKYKFPYDILFVEAARAVDYDNE